MEQTMNYITDHFIRRKLEPINNVFRIVIEAHAIAAYAKHLEIRHKGHAPKRSIEKTEMNRKGSARLFQDVICYRKTAFVALTLSRHAFLGSNRYPFGNTPGVANAQHRAQCVLIARCGIQTHLRALLFFAQ